MNYRAEIDGLRAFAVLSVIIYHAEVTLYGDTLLQGGYIGVDIFFVISGYLISRLLLSELFQHGRISFTNFYERRARRILPMLFVVILVTFPFAWRYLLPAEFIEYSESILSAVFFGSNFYFYHTTTEYGADSALLKPFLHTWSLGIEEQFYIIFPILLILTYRFMRQHLLAVMVGGLIISLAVSMIAGQMDTDLNFYLPVSRFWELLAGSLIAYHELKHGRIEHARTNAIFTLSGLALIVWSVLAFDGNTSHPGLITVLPILGVVLLILYSSPADPVGRWLCAKPVVFIGLISYSAYLWHFPVMAFARIGQSNPDNADKLLWISISLVLSVCSYYWVEKPFRNRTQIKTPAFTTVLTVAAVSLIGINVMAIVNEGHQSRFPAWVSEDVKPSDRLQQNGELCVDRVRDFCRFTGNPDKPLMITIGDSHMASVEYFLVQNHADEFNFITASVKGCPMFLGHSRYKIKDDRPHICTAEYQAERLRLIQDNPDSIVILYSRMPLYIEKNRFRNYHNNDEGKEWGSYFQDNAGKPIDYASAFNDTIAAISQYTSRIIVVYPTPEFGHHPARTLIQKYGHKLMDDEATIDNIEMSTALYRQRSQRAVAILDGIDTRVYTVSPEDIFCTGTDTGTCLANDGPQLFYSDFDHLSEDGAALLNEQIINMARTISEK